jgi:hypothetical protein
MGTQPVAASGAVLINTLHGPSRQILHVLPPVAAHAGKSAAAEAARCGDCCAGAVWCQDKTTLGMGAGLRRLWISCEMVRRVG